MPYLAFLLFLVPIVLRVPKLSESMPERRGGSSRTVAFLRHLSSLSSQADRVAHPLHDRLRGLPGALRSIDEHLVDIARIGSQ